MVAVGAGGGSEGGDGVDGEGWGEEVEGAWFECVG